MTTDSIEQKFTFFDMAAIQSMAESSNDLELLLEPGGSVDIVREEDGTVKLICDFTRYAMDSNGYHVGYEGCRVIFETFDASKLMCVNDMKKECRSMHGLGIDLELSIAEFEIEPVRKEISWREIFSDNCPELAPYIDTFMDAENDYEGASEFDEGDFCQWMEVERGVKITREDYYDSYTPGDDDFWFQELEDRFDKLLEVLRRTSWKFNPDHEEQESDPWYLETVEEVRA